MEKPPIERYLIDGDSALDPAALQELFEKIKGRPATPEEIREFAAELEEPDPE
jgi:hypothetical protein